MIPADKVDDIPQLHIDVMKTIDSHHPEVEEVIHLCAGILAGCVVQLPAQKQAAMRADIIRHINNLSSDSDRDVECIDFAPLMKHNKN